MHEMRAPSRTLGGKKEQDDNRGGEKKKIKVNIGADCSFIQLDKDPEEIRGEKHAVHFTKYEERRQNQGGNASKGLQTTPSNREKN